MASPGTLIALLAMAASAAAANMAAYDDNFGRHKMFPLAAASYGDDISKCLGVIAKNFTMVRRVDKPCDELKDNCAGFAAVSHDDRAIILSFRGTNTVTELVTEIAEVALEPKQAFIGGGNVCGYFKKSYESVWNNGILESFTELAKQYPDYNLWITGHSLGGSMASLAALYIAKLSLFDPAKIRVVTFGQPRTGDQEYTAAVDHFLPYYYRVTHSHDVVPHVPLELMGYYHHQQEVYYPNDMKDGAAFMNCPGDENKHCSDDNLVDASVTDHLWYFNLLFPTYGMSGCQLNI